MRPMPKFNLFKPLIEIGPPLSSRAVKILLLGSGELGKEVALEAQRLGLEVISVDRYDNAPAMHVAHRRYVIDMMNEQAVKAIVKREQPDLIIPEIEAVSTTALRELEDEGYRVTPNAKAVEISMNRIILREYVVKEVGLPTTRYAIAESPEEVFKACNEIGYPCIIKPEMSSSGHGHVKITNGSFDQVRKAFEESIRHARGKSRRVLVEEYVELDAEFTVLTYRHVNMDGRVETITCDPIEHWRYGEFHYIESWQPSTRSAEILGKIAEIGVKIADSLGGLGIYGVEVFLTRDNRVLFSEVAPRPHDTGLVTIASQELSEFAIHLRAGLGLPVPRPKVVNPAASLAIYSEIDTWSPVIHGIREALSIPGVDIRIFGKPYVYTGRRVAVLLARGDTVSEALDKVRKAGRRLKVVGGWGKDAV